MSENNYTTNWPKADKTTYYSHSSTYSVVCNEDGKPTTIKYDDSPTVIDKLDIQTKDVVIHFKDGESASYNNAYDLQDFLNQVNHYHDLQEAFRTVVKKLLEIRPELDQWIEQNFKKYL